MFYESNQYRLANIVNILSKDEMEIIEERARENSQKESKNRYSMSSDLSSGMSESSIIPKKRKHKSLRRSQLMEKIKQTSSIQAGTFKNISKWFEGKGPEDHSQNSSSNSSNAY